MLDRLRIRWPRIVSIVVRASPETVPSMWQLHQGQPFQGGMQVNAEAEVGPEVTKEWQVGA